MEAYTAFVRADCIIELHAITDIVLHLTVVIDPCYTECENTVRLDHTLNDLVTLKLRMLVINRLNTHEHFSDSLKVFLFARVFGLKAIHDTINVHLL